MTKNSNDKTKSGGKSKAMSTKEASLTLPKKVRTETAKITAKLGNSVDDGSSEDFSFVDTSIPPSRYLHRSVAEKEYTVHRLMSHATIGYSHAASQDVRDSKRDLCYGNLLFLQWVDCGLKWPRCERFDAPFAMLGRKSMTWETSFEHIFQSEGRKWDCLESLLRQALDLSAFAKGDKTEEDRMWVVRCLTMGVALSDPIAVLDYTAPTYSDGSSKFWDRANPLNLRLLVESRPFAKFWVLCTDLLDIPCSAPGASRVQSVHRSLQAKKAESSKERKRDRLIDPKQLQHKEQRLRSSPILQHEVVVFLRFSLSVRQLLLDQPQCPATLRRQHPLPRAPPRGRLRHPRTIRHGHPRCPSSLPLHAQGAHSCNPRPLS